MQGKSFFISIILFILCVFAYPQDIVNNFIDNNYLYHKYLPLEYISEYFALRNLLVYVKEKDQEEFLALSKGLDERIRFLNDIVLEQLQKETQRVKQKMEDLNELYGIDSEIMSLTDNFLVFEDDVNKKKMPKEDLIIERIDEHYSRLITRLNYSYRNGNQGGYLVKTGDCLWKIALYHYGNSHLWRVIYEANKNNRNFLPKPSNWHLIYPGVRIYIPPKPE